MNSLEEMPFWAWLHLTPASLGGASHPEEPGLQALPPTLVACLIQILPPRLSQQPHQPSHLRFTSHLKLNHSKCQ